ncbi:hypothetical protein GCM10027020_37010 [Nocardioides salsibiostraticola]
MPLWTFLLTLLAVMVVITLTVLALTGPGPGSMPRGRHASRADRAHPLHAVTPLLSSLAPEDQTEDDTEDDTEDVEEDAEKEEPGDPANPDPSLDRLSHRERATALARAGDLPAAAAAQWSADLEALGFEPGALIAPRTARLEDTPSTDDGSMLLDRGRRLLASLAGPATRGRTLYADLSRFGPRVPR